MVRLLLSSQYIRNVSAITAAFSPFRSRTAEERSWKDREGCGSWGRDAPIPTNYEVRGAMYKLPLWGPGRNPVDLESFIGLQSRDPGVDFADI